MHEQYYYTQLYDAVSQRQYKDVPFKLRRLGNEHVSFVKSNDMTEFFNKHKDGCMRGILYILKNHGDYGLTGKDFVAVVKGARKIGLDWPELDVIEKTGNSMQPDISLWDDETEVDESDNMSNDQAEANMHYEGLIDDLREDIYDDIRYWFQFIGRKGRPDHLMPVGFFDRHKTGILKRILSAMKYADEYDYSNRDIQDIIQGARNIGLTWPELDAIEKSIGKDTLDEAQRDYTIDDALKDINGLYGNIGDRYAWVNKTIERLVLLYSALADAAHIKEIDDITRTIDSYKHQIIKDMLHNMKHGPRQIAMQVFIDTLRRFGIDWPELHAFEKSIVKKVDETMRVNLKDPRERMLDRLEFIFNDPDTDVFDRVSELDIAGSVLRRISQADVDAILAKYKTDIIRDTLHYLRNGVVHIDFPTFIRILRELGANWPELDIIAKSINKPKQLGEARDASTSYNLNGVISSIEADELRETVLFLSQLSWANNLPDMSDELAPYIQSIIKAMLEFLKYEESDSEPVETVRDCLTALKKMNIHSKEIDIIDRSLSIGQQP